MPKKLSTEEVNNRLLDRGIVLVGEYINANTKASFRCSVGHVWETKPSVLLNMGFGCPYCSGKAKLTPEVINQELSNKGIQIVGKYVNNRTPTLFRCENGHEWNTTINAVKNLDSNCPICKKEGRSKTKLYVMYSESLGTKIGISNKPGTRLGKISRNANIPDLKLFKVFDILDYTKCRKIEKAAHEHFKEWNCYYKDFDGATEFFDIEPDTAVKFIEENIND
ncbi:endonuclease [Escherichia phage vB_EcoS_AKFV33]|uniref:Bacteriophage T5 Orf172 DNA-binding domain-containing protein n=1 Tax=Escherichia phage vB_EcoS_AKFV33 TaxID=2681605 RepID=I1TE00_9CAUD|nr:endonuclease [Escherichia phage vB_EcoS_AKFV33]AET24712.1 hypothetical protein [Escherichia phage vB_EcoS_AKFV33]